MTCSRVCFIGVKAVSLLKAFSTLSATFVTSEEGISFLILGNVGTEGIVGLVSVLLGTYTTFGMVGVEITAVSTLWGFVIMCTTFWALGTFTSCFSSGWLLTTLCAVLGSTLMGVGTFSVLNFVCVFLWEDIVLLLCVIVLFMVCLSCVFLLFSSRVQEWVYRPRYRLN